MSESVAYKSTITISDIFPSLPSGTRPTPMQGEVLALSQRIGVPYPAEPNAQYSNWWRALHEVGHWAIKPDWYNASDATIRRFEGPPSDEVIGLHPGMAKNTIHYYAAGNDVIPNIGLRYSVDPTPTERSVRAWSILTMHAEGWEHPFRTILRENISPQAMMSRGDDGWHKIATAQVWAPSTVAYPGAVLRMGRFGLNPLIGAYRPEDDGFIPPHPQAKTPAEQAKNHAAVREHYPLAGVDKPTIPEYPQLDDEYWQVYTEWKSVHEDPHPNTYESLLERFDAVSQKSIALFERHWATVAEQFGRRQTAASTIGLIAVGS